MQHEPAQQQQVIQPVILAKSLPQQKNGINGAYPIKAHSAQKHRSVIQPGHNFSLVQPLAGASLSTRLTTNVSKYSLVVQYRNEAGLGPHENHVAVKDEQRKLRDEIAQVFALPEERLVLGYGKAGVHDENEVTARNLDAVEDPVEQFHFGMDIVPGLVLFPSRNSNQLHGNTC